MQHVVPFPSDKQRFFELQYLVGQTPLIRINNLLNPNPNVEVYAKAEWMQLGGSVKARPAYAIMRDALLSGELSAHRGILDASSGNTGIAYAVFAAISGIPVTLCLPDNASRERKSILKNLGVNVIPTSPFESTDGAQRVAAALSEEHGELYCYTDQYSNDANWKAHFDTTAEEIWEQTNMQVSHFIAGLGTTGTFVGTTRKLKLLNSGIKCISLQPDLALHGMEGWKHLETARVPRIYDPEAADESRSVSTDKAYNMIVEAARKQDLLLSPSSAANLSGALQLASELDRGIVVTIFPDDSSKYSEVYSHLNL